MNSKKNKKVRKSTLFKDWLLILSSTEELSHSTNPFELSFSPSAFSFSPVSLNPSKFSSRSLAPSLLTNLFFANSLSSAIVLPKSSGDPSAGDSYL